MPDSFKEHEQEGRVKDSLDNFRLNSFIQSSDSLFFYNVIDNLVPLLFIHTDMLFGSDYCNWVCAESGYHFRDSPNEKNHQIVPP